MKMLFLSTMLLFGQLATADVTDDMVNRALTDPVSAAKIVVVPIRYRGVLENALSGLADFRKNGPVDLYRTTIGTNIVVRAITRDSKLDKGCYELRLTLAKDQLRYHYDDITVSVCDARVGLARAFFERSVAGQSPNDMIQGYSSSRVRDFVERDIRKLFIMRSDLTKTGIRNEEKFEATRDNVIATFESYGDKGLIAGNCFKATFSFESVEGHLLLTNVYFSKFSK